MTSFYSTMASGEGDQKEENLASKMEKGTVNTLDDVEAILSSSNAEVNTLNSLGQTPLMIACGKGDKEMVAFLLNHGADPNARCARDGNTPMHYASLNYQCKCLLGQTCSYTRPFSQKYEQRIDTIKNLISHGATLMCNSNGLNPPSLAALHQCREIVEFFCQIDLPTLQMSEEEKSQLYDMLGMAVVLDAYFYSSSGIPYFLKAATIRAENDIKLDQNHEQSDIVAAFSLFKAGDPCSSVDDWKGLCCDRIVLKIQAFFIADRLVPEEMKTTYILQSIFNFAESRIFTRRRERADPPQCHGLKIFKELLPFELQSKLTLGKVLSGILRSIEGEGEAFPLYDGEIKECMELMNRCLKVFEDVSEQRLLKVSKALLNQLAKFWQKWGFIGGCRSKDRFEPLVDFTVKMVDLFRRRCSSDFSIIHYIFDEINEEDFCPCGRCREDGPSLETIQYRMKRLIFRMIPYDDASRVNAKGNTMLHSLMEAIEYLEPSFSQDVALILVRNGCPIDARNNDGETAEDMIGITGNYLFDFRNKKLQAYVTSPTSVLPLEELAARTILRHKIQYQGALPKHLSATVRGKLDPDELLFPPPEDSIFFHSDSDSFDGRGCEFDDEQDYDFNDESHHESDEESNEVEDDSDDLDDDSNEDGDD